MLESQAAARLAPRRAFRKSRSHRAGQPSIEVLSLYAVLTAILCCSARKRKICKILLGHRTTGGRIDAPYANSSARAKVHFDAKSRCSFFGTKGKEGSKATTTGFAPLVFDYAASASAGAARTCSVAFESSG